MTYSYRYWTAFREADLLNAGDHSINVGDTFTMPANSTVTLAAYDNDAHLSGDSHDRATDNDGHYDQFGWVNDGSGWHKTGDLYVEKVYTLQGSDGQTYLLAEIEGEKLSESQDFFSFVGATPPAGVSLELVSSDDSHGVKYSDLSADASAAPTNVAPEFTNLPGNGVLHIDENTTAVIDIDASDADGDTLTYEIVGGRDAAFFEIDAHTGALSFKSAPDFENPQSGGNSNTYDVTVKVSDGNGGSETKTLWVKVKDVDENTGGDPECIVIEAEDMHESGFKVAHAANASGGEILKLDHAGGNGDVWTTFNGEGGTYDLTLRAQDENDGQSTIYVKVNGHTVGTIVLDRDSDGSGSNNGGFSDFTLEGLEINNGDTVSLWVDGDAGEFVRLDKLTFKAVEEQVDPNLVCLDFEGLAAGTVVDMQFDGVMISAQRDINNTAANDAMIFDSNNPTGGDTDLATNGQNNILIISEDNDSSDPDDAIGGTIWFKFDNPASVDSIKIVDAEEGGNIRLLDENGALIAEVAIPNGTDGGIQTVDINVDGVAQIDLTLNGSGAVDDLKYIPGEAPATGALEGRYFCDENRDETDNGEPGVAGATVWLVQNGQVVATTTTGSDGTYRFDDLAAGDYTVRFENPDEVAGSEGKVFVAPDSGDDANDSDVINVGGTGNGNTGTVTVVAGETTSNVDAGIADPGNASLAGVVFMDNNDNSVEDAGDMRIANVTVELLDANGDVVGTTTTNGNGAYEFTGLTAGDYSVRFPTNVDGKVLVDSNVGGDDTVDSDADQGTGETGTISLGIGERVEDIDAGLEVVDTGDAAIEGTVFMDNNDNSVQDAGDMVVEGVTVELLDANGDVIDTAVTNGNGDYRFDGLNAGDYSVRFPTDVNGKVLVDSNVGGDDTVDSDADQGTGETGTISLGIGEVSSNNDAGIEDPGNASLAGVVFMDNNDNSVEDAGDMRVPGVTVELLDANGDVIDTATTDGNGAYEFTGLDAGDYSVRFPTDVNGKVLVDSNVGGDDTVDSDADQVTGETQTVNLGIGERVEDLDAGIEDPNGSAIEGTVFMDNNDNSVQDAGDMPIANVTVELLDANGDVIDTTTTNVNGDYRFDGLAAGDYSVRFPTDVDGKVLVDANQGGDDTVDSDADQVTGETGTITLGINETSSNNDAGVEDPGTAALGDKVFIDANGNGQQDAGEVGLDGVGVTLFDENGNVAGQTTTQNGGMYLFSGLAAGTYTVGFAEADGFDFTTANQGNDATDSDADQATGLTGPIVLGIGEENLTVDAGVVAENGVPTPADDTAETCADDEVTVDVLDNDSDPDGDALSITMVDGQAISEGGSVTTAAGTVVSLQGGQLVVDGEAAYAALDIGESAVETISYKVDDGNGGTATANLDVTFKGDANDYQSLSDSLPMTGNVVITDTGDGPDAFDLTVNGTGDARFDGVTFDQAYCLSFFDPIPAGQSVATDISGAKDPSVPGIFEADQVSGFNGEAAADNMDLIQYILAQDWENNTSVDYGGWDVQFAIWELTDNIDTDDWLGTFPGADPSSVDAILADAAANGEGFMPTGEGIVSAVFDPNPQTPGVIEQPFIVAFNFDDYDCIC